jgi:predicted nucleic-acid-binding protein
MRFGFQGRKNRYGYGKQQIAEALLQLMETDNIAVEDSEAVKLALHDYKDHQVDFADCLIAGKAGKQGLPVVTWNKRDFKRLNCEFYSP